LYQQIRIGTIRFVLPKLYKYGLKKVNTLYSIPSNLKKVKSFSWLDGPMTCRAGCFAQAGAGLSGEYPVRLLTAQPCDAVVHLLDDVVQEVLFFIDLGEQGEVQV